MDVTATDYFLIELVTFVVTSLTFFILGLYEDDYLRSQICYIITVMFSYTTSVLLLTTGEAFSLVASLGFLFFGSLSFLFIVVRLWEAYAPRFKERGRSTE